MNLRPEEPENRIETDEAERMIDLKANLEYCRSLVAHAAFYLINFKWPMVAINVETGEYRDLNFRDENWDKCLIDPGLNATKISLGVRTGSLSRLLVLEVANAEHQSRLDGWGPWRSKCVAELDTTLERHFFTLPADFQLHSSDVSGTDIRIFTEGEIKALPPSIDPASQLEWRWQGPPWGSSPTPLPLAIINFLQALQQPAAGASEFQAGFNRPMNPLIQGQQDEKSLKNRIMEPETNLTGLDNSAPMATLEGLRESQDPDYLDELTGIANRRYLEIFIAAKFNELNRLGQPFGVILADLDHFKQVNDTFGREVGDSILKMVAETIMENCRSFDLAGRWGGGEFLWVLANLQDEGQLKNKAERLRTLMANSWSTLPDHDVRVTISLGATMARPQDTPETLIRRVDGLLYLSKAAGRNYTTFE